MTDLNKTLLDSINKIDEYVIESETNVCAALCDSYAKALTIMEYSNSTEIVDSLLIMEAATNNSADSKTKKKENIIIRFFKAIINFFVSIAKNIKTAINSYHAKYKESKNAHPVKELNPVPEKINENKEKVIPHDSEKEMAKKIDDKVNDSSKPSNEVTVELPSIVDLHRQYSKFKAAFEYASKIWNERDNNKLSDSVLNSLKKKIFEATNIKINYENYSYFKELNPTHVVDCLLAPIEGGIYKGKSRIDLMEECADTDFIHIGLFDIKFKAYSASTDNILDELDDTPKHHKKDVDADLKEATMTDEERENRKNRNIDRTIDSKQFDRFQNMLQSMNNLLSNYNKNILDIKNKLKKITDGLSDSDYFNSSAGTVEKKAGYYGNHF